MSEQEALLAQLQDVRLPPVSHWPAPGWWLLAALAVGLMITGLVWRKRRQQQYWQYETSMVLQGLRREVSSTPAAEILARVSVLVRQLLLLVEQRSDIASLQGEELLGTLDNVCGKPVFSNGPGRLLANGPYQRSPDTPPEELSALLDAVDLLKVSVGRQLRQQVHQTPAVSVGQTHE
ncbi:MAG: DUF4381 domain-containing protein [Granulosicoccus sp.]